MPVLVTARELWWVNQEWLELRWGRYTGREIVALLVTPCATLLRNSESNVHYATLHAVYVFLFWMQLYVLKEYPARDPDVCQIGLRYRQYWYSGRLTRREKGLRCSDLKNGRHVNISRNLGNFLNVWYSFCFIKEHFDISFFFTYIHYFHMVLRALW
jgi:hypothetical protein